MKRQGSWLSAVVFMAAACTGFVQAAAAQSVEPICAAVLPCDENGGLLPQYAAPQNPCRDLYLSQCAAYKLGQEQEAALRERIQSLEAENALLKKRLKALKRGARSAGR